MDVKLLCVICKRMTQDWAVCEVPAGVEFKIVKKRVKAVAGDNVCGGCMSHAVKTKDLTPEQYKKISANVKNAVEKQRTINEFKK